MHQVCSIYTGYLLQGRSKSEWRGKNVNQINSIRVVKNLEKRKNPKLGPNDLTQEVLLYMGCWKICLPI